MLGRTDTRTRDRMYGLLSVDTNSLRHLPRRSSNNCDLQFDNLDRHTDNYIVTYILVHCNAPIVEGKAKLTARQNANTIIVLCSREHQFNNKA